MTEKTLPSKWPVRRPTNVRATVSEEEWNQFRAKATIANQSSTQRLGDLIRADLARETQ